MRVVLASQSPARKRLLKRIAPALGLSVSVKPAHLDEEALARNIKSPERIVQELARQKARAIHNGKAATIGSDQIFLCRGKVFGKPHTSEKAIKQLMLASGQWCELHTAVCVITPHGEEVSFINVTRLKFRKLTREEARQYVSLDAPESCAGSFKFESLGITLFDEVETSDPSAIEGLPLIQLANTLRQI